MNVCELTLDVLTFPPQVKNRYHNIRNMKDVEFMRGLGRRLLVNYGC
jgi:hypothetical protein